MGEGRASGALSTDAAGASRVLSNAVKLPPLIPCSSLERRAESGSAVAHLPALMIPIKLPPYCRFALNSPPLRIRDIVYV